MKRYGPYPSSSGPNEYWVTINEEGMIACAGTQGICRGFTILKKGKPHYCSHTDDVMKKLGVTSEIRGDFQFIVEHGSVQMDLLPPKDSPSDTLKYAKERGYVRPMLAIAPEKGKTVDDYSAEDHVMELKYDGERKIVSLHNGKVYVWNRPQRGDGEVGKEEPFPPQIHNAFQALADAGLQATIDGEMYLPGATQSTDVNRLENRPFLKFAAFDLLRVGNPERSATTLENSYLARRLVLEGLISSLKWPGEPTILLSEQWEPNQAGVQAIWDRGGEGVIIKRKDSPYRPGFRSKDWIKVKLLASIRMQIKKYKKGKEGPHASVICFAEDGSKADVKTKNGEIREAMAKNPDYYIDKWLVIEYRGRSSKGGYRHPMWQYLEEEVQ